MNKKLCKVFLVFVFVFALFCIVGPAKLSANTATDQDKVNTEVQGMRVPERAIIDFPLTSNSVFGSTIEWTSSDQTVIKINGSWAEVTRSADADKQVTLTVVVSLNEKTATDNFVVNVPKGTTLTNQYAINYVLNGGTNSQSNPTTYKVGSQVQLAEPTKGVLGFLGWHLNADFSDTAITVLPKGISGDVTLYANWEAPSVTGITVTTQPTKTTYNALESFDSAGMVVEAKYNYGENQVITGYSIDKTVLHGNDTFVTVSYSGFQQQVNITVNKLTYDMSGITFANASKPYNGLLQGLTIAGTLHSNLSVQYSEGITNVGTVDITASFANTDPVDYVTPGNMTAELTITAVTLTVTGSSATIKVGDPIPTLTANYSGFVNNEDETVLEGLLSISCQATSSSPAGQYSVIPSGLTSINYNIEFVNGLLVITNAAITIYVDPSTLTKQYNGQNQTFTAVAKSVDVEITSIQLSYKIGNTDFTGATNVGTYVVVVSYDDATYGDGTQPFTFKITKATYNLDGVSFSNKTVEYTGEAQTIAISGTLPNGVTVQYSNGITNVGSIQITASFAGDTVNYELIPDMKATLTITEAELTTAMFDAIPLQQYTGSDVEPTITGTFNGKALTAEDFDVVYTNNVDRGDANAAVTGKGNFKGTVNLAFTISDADLETVKEAKEYLATLNLTQPTQLPITYSGATIFWTPSSTAMVIDATGAVTYNKLDVTQTVILTAVITKNDSVDYASFTVEVAAANATPIKTVSEMIELEVSDTEYQVTGIVANIANSTDGRFDLIDPNDPTKSIYVFKLTNANKDANSFASLDVKEGDTLTLIGKRGLYNTTIEILDAYFVSRTKGVFSVNVVVNDSALGTATSNITTAARDTEVTITFIPAEGKKVGSVKKNNAEVIVANNEYVFTLEADTEINVTFVDESYVAPTKQWTKATSVSQITEGSQVIITAVKNETQYGVPSATSTSNPPAATAINITDGETEGTNDYSSFIFTVSLTSDNYFVFTNSDGKTLYTTNSNNGVRINTTVGEWILNYSGDVFTITSVSRADADFALYNTQDWRTYTSDPNTCIKALSIYVLTTGSSN